jgi:hypothetical protein
MEAHLRKARAHAVVRTALAPHEASTTIPRWIWSRDSFVIIV